MMSRRDLDQTEMNSLIDLLKLIQEDTKSSVEQKKESSRIIADFIVNGVTKNDEEWIVFLQTSLSAPDRLGRDMLFLPLSIECTFRAQETMVDQWIKANIAASDWDNARCMSRRWIFLCPSLLLWDPTYEYAVALGPSGNNANALVDLLLANVQEQSRFIYFMAANSVCRLMKAPSLESLKSHAVSCSDHEFRRIFRMNNQAGLSKGQIPPLDIEVNNAVYRLSGNVDLNPFFANRKVENICKLKRFEFFKRSTSEWLIQPFFEKIPALLEYLRGDNDRWREYEARVNQMQEWFLKDLEGPAMMCGYHELAQEQKSKTKKGLKRSASQEIAFNPAIKSAAQSESPEPDFGSFESIEWSDEMPNLFLEGLF